MWIPLLKSRDEKYGGGQRTRSSSIRVREIVDK